MWRRTARRPGAPRARRLVRGNPGEYSQDDMASPLQNSRGPIDFCHDFGRLCRPTRQGTRGLPVLLARQFIGAATTALSLIAGAFLPALAASNVQTQASAPVCDAAG